MFPLSFVHFQIFVFSLFHSSCAKHKAKSSLARQEGSLFWWYITEKCRCKESLNLHKRMFLQFPPYHSIGQHQYSQASLYTVNQYLRKCVTMLLCHKATQDFDSAAYCADNKILMAILHFPVCLWRIACFFLKAFSKVAHLIKSHSRSNIADRLICFC